MARSSYFGRAVVRGLMRRGRAMSFVSLLSIASALLNCSDSEPSSEPDSSLIDRLDASTDARAENADLDASTDARLNASRDAANPDADATRQKDASESEFGLLFQDTFKNLGPPYVDGYDQSPWTLPEALFPRDETRWTQLQNTHPGENRMGYDGALGAVRFFASGQADGVASKMGIGRGAGLELREGDTVLVGADFYVEESVSALKSSTLIDIEDTDDLTIDGDEAGAGLRVRINDQGRLSLDRGELIGSDAGEPAHFRLNSMTSEYELPGDTWVRVEALLRLGSGVERSATGPIDATFAADKTPAWCELWIEPRGGERRMVLRQKGTTFLDRRIGLEVFATEAPDVVVSWPRDLDFNSIQVGLTNNRSTIAQQLLVDNVRIERLEQAGPPPGR